MAGDAATLLAAAAADLEGSLDGLIEEMLAAIGNEVPAYRLGPGDVRRTFRQAFRRVAAPALRSLAGGAPVSEDELGVLRNLGSLRARQGIPLRDVEGT